MEKKTIKAMIFDMDGTVINSNPIDFEAWKRILSEYDIKLEYDDYVKLLGAKSSEIVKMHVDLPESEIENFIERREQYFREIVEQKGIEPFPGMVELLKQVKDVPLKTALATGAQMQKVDYLLERFEMKKYFDAIVTADEVNAGKPHPEIFLKAAEKLSVSPGEVIVWEDAERGVEAAKEGGFRCICITTTNHGKEGLEKADLPIDSYETIDVKEIIRRINNSQ